MRSWKTLVPGLIILLLVIVASAQQTFIQRHFLDEHVEVFNDSTTLEAEVKK